MCQQWRHVHATIREDGRNRNDQNDRSRMHGGDLRVAGRAGSRIERLRGDGRGLLRALRRCSRRNPGAPPRRGLPDGQAHRRGVLAGQPRSRALELREPRPWDHGRRAQRARGRGDMFEEARRRGAFDPLSDLRMPGNRYDRCRIARLLAADRRLARRAGSHHDRGIGGVGRGTRRVQDAVCDRGLAAGVLYSSNYRSLRRGFWVVFSGTSRTRQQASLRTSQVRSRGYRNAYTRFVR